MREMPGRAVALKVWLLTLVVVLTNVLGNFSLSWGMKHSAYGLTPLGVLRTVFTPWVLAGIALLILWLLTRLTLLSWADLSFVLPVTASGYVLTVMLGRFALGEEVSWQRWTGAVLIAVGTSLVGATQPKTAGAKGKTA